VPRVPRIKPPA